MKITDSLVDQLEELASDVFNIGDRLTQAAEELRLAQSFHPQGVVAEMEDSRKNLLDVSGRLLELGKSVSPSDADSIPSDMSSPAPTPEEVVSLRPARRDERLPTAGDASLGKKWEEAEARLTGLRQLIERALRAESATDAAINLGNLALQYHQKGKLDEAERLYRHALAFREQFFGSEHALVATRLNNLAILCRDRGKYDEAASLFQRSLEITAKAHGAEHPKVARRLSNLASLYLREEKYAEAKTLFERLLAIGEKQPRVALPEVMANLKKYAEFLRKTNRAEEAATVDARVQSIRAQRRPGGEIHSTPDWRESPNP